MPVSNSSPLIHLARLGKLGFARNVYPSIFIPPAVRAETIERGKIDGFDDALILEKMEREGWIQIGELSPGSRNLANDLTSTVGEGEAQAIALAIEKKERLFIDDLKGRRLAEHYKIETTTTLGVIFELLARKYLSQIDYARNVKNYGSGGWIGGEVLQEFLEKGRDVR